jgi:hypothetical protein
MERIGKFQKKRHGVLLFCLRNSGICTRYVLTEAACTQFATEGWCGLSGAKECELTFFSIFLFFLKENVVLVSVYILLYRDKRFCKAGKLAYRKDSEIH